MFNYHLRHNQVLHQQVLLLSVFTTDEPMVMSAKRIDITPLGYGIYRVQLYYGFKQEQRVLESLKRASDRGLLKLVPSEMTFYFGRETLVPAVYGGPLLRFRRWVLVQWLGKRNPTEPPHRIQEKAGLVRAISERVFVLMHRNALRATDLFRIPDDLTVEMGLRLQTASLSSDKEPGGYRTKKRPLFGAGERALIVRRVFNRWWRVPRRL